ncbi:MAG: YdeI/OmpD-associated family protein [Saprospiraceae bacterium]|nr:YdeI/OmpD-associated family protein [Saprospiraceae bacterium]
MTPLFKKLNFKDQHPVVILQAPENFAVEMQAMQAFAELHPAFEGSQKAGFVLAFATRQTEVDAFALAFAEQTEGDAVLWLAYPKSSSKRYRCDFNRDTGWAMLGTLGFEPVRQVAIDEDWSALRFRRVEFIETLRRSFALSEAGKAKAVPAAPLAVPDELLAAFEQAPAAKAFFEQLAPSHRKEYLRWIEEAKRPETRARRVQQTLERLLEGKKLN